MTLKEYLESPTNEIPQVEAENVLGWQEIFNEPFEFVEDCLVYLGDDREKLTSRFTNVILTAVGDEMELEDYLKQYFWFIQQLVNIAEMKQQRESKTKRPDMKHLIELIDFNGFNYFGDVYTLMDGDITRYDDIMNMKWIVCHTYLLYKSKCDDLEYMYQEESVKKRNKK